MLRAVASFIVVLVGVLSICYWQRENSILGVIASLWIVSDNIEPADVIVVLGGAHDVRAPAAAALYKSGFATQILIANTSQTDAENEVSFSEINRQTLLNLQVPGSAIRYFGHGLSSTYEEARALLVW